MKQTQKSGLFFSPSPRGNKQETPELLFTRVKKKKRKETTKRKKTMKTVIL